MRPKVATHNDENACSRKENDMAYGGIKACSKKQYGMMYGTIKAVMFQERMWYCV